MKKSIIAALSSVMILACAVFIGVSAMVMSNSVKITSAQTIEFTPVPEEFGRARPMVMDLRQYPAPGAWILTEV